MECFRVVRLERAIECRLLTAVRGCKALRARGMKFFGRSKLTKHGMLLDRPVDDDGRCRECDGQCCRAFPNVNLSWPEYERLKSLGAHRLDFSLTGHHTLIIENGCEFLFAGKCSIYEHRPDTCRRFFCRDE